MAILSIPPSFPLYVLFWCVNAIIHKLQATQDFESL